MGGFGLNPATFAAGGSFLSGLSALGGGIGGLVGGAGQNRAAKAEARRGRRHQINLLQNQIGWKMWDMEKAGLNPILAAGGAFGGGAPSGPQAPVVNPGLAGAQSASALATGAKVSLMAGKQMVQLQRQNELLEAQRLKTDAERILLEANVPAAALKNSLMTGAIELLTESGLVPWIKSMIGDEDNNPKQLSEQEQAMQRRAEQQARDAALKKKYGEEDDGTGLLRKMERRRGGKNRR